MKCNTTILWWNKHKQQLERSNPRNGSSLLPAKTDLITSKQLFTTIRNGGSFEKWLTTIRGSQPLGLVVSHFSNLSPSLMHSIPSLGSKTRTIWEKPVDIIIT
jgi:hypothetical protein